MQKNNPVICHLEERCLIRISGIDATSFLQDMVTNDVTKIGQDQIVYACLLTPQGRFLHDFFISKEGDNFFLECETGRRADLIRRLNIFKLKAKVVIEDCYGLFGIYTSNESPEGIVSFQDPRLNALGYRFYLPGNKTYPGAIAQEIYRDRRISLGIPEGSSDIRPEIDTPANVNLDYLNTISWDKGCYVGQEITALTKNRGVVKKRMLIVSGPMLTAGSIISHNGHAVGEIRNVNSLRTQGLAILKLVALDDSSGQLVSSDGTVLAAQLPDWLKLEKV